MEIGKEVIHGLGKNASPVDGIDGCQMMRSVEFSIGEKSFYDVLSGV